MCEMTDLPATSEFLRAGSLRCWRSGARRRAGCAHWRRHWATTVALIGLERDRNAARLIWHRLGVDVVPALITSRAGVEGAGAVDREGAVAADFEAWAWGGTDIALPLGGRWGQDAAAAVTVGQA